MEAGFLGKKSGRGYYNYNSEQNEKINEDNVLGKEIVLRVVSMLINEAADALYLNIATKEDIDLAMTKGVNYPMGLFKWADDIGVDNVLNKLGIIGDPWKEYSTKQKSSKTRFMMKQALMKSGSKFNSEYYHLKTS